MMIPGAALKTAAAAAALIVLGTMCAYAEELPVHIGFENSSDWTVEGSAVISESKASYDGGTARVSRRVSGIENGVYDITAYTTSESSEGICYVYAKTSGHTMASTSVPVSDTVTAVTVPGIVVEDGSFDVGFYASGSGALTVSSFELTASEGTRVPFLKGGEISKLTYVEDKKGRFYRSDGTEGDALQILAENGFNLARIRLLDDPGKGHGDGTYYLPAEYQTEEDCLELAHRAKDKGMQIEFTIAYSDYWSDGVNQFMPNAWQRYIDENSLSFNDMVAYLEQQVYEYTADIMQKLIDNGVCPEYVSIGNEIQYGMLFGNYQKNNGLYNKEQYIVKFLNAGARAVREKSPETKIIVHSDCGGKIFSSRRTFAGALDSLDFDVLGVSYYPYYNGDVSIETVVNEFNTFISQYDKDVIIMETGYNWSELRGDGYDGQLKDNGYYQNIYGETEAGQRAFLTELYAKLKQTAGGRCIGDLYWDPIMLYDNAKYVIGWAISEDGDWTQGNEVSNSNLFDFSGKALDSHNAMKYNTNSSDKLLITGKVKKDGAISAYKPVRVNVNGVTYTSKTDRFGEYIVAVPYPENGYLNIASALCAQTYNMEAPYDGVLVEGIDLNLEECELSISVKDGKINYSIEAQTGASSLYVALYNKDMQLIEIAKDTTKGAFNTSDHGRYTVKAYIWDGANSPDIEPLVSDQIEL